MMVLKNGNRGKVLTAEDRAKKSKSLTGRTFSESHRKNISKWQKGRKLPLETRIKMGNSRRGERNPLWNGGSSYEPYSVDWTKTLKRSIRERDKYTCRICGALQKDRTFNVHHIDYNKKNCSPDNLITLCHSCHIKTNSHRDYWKDYFRKEDNARRRN